MVCRKYPKEFRHYDVSLMKKGFARLRNNVWENKMNWHLMMKADCHYKLKLLSLCFYAWRLFLKRIHRKVENEIIAKKHYEKKIMKKGYTGLLYYVDYSWRMVKSIRKALDLSLKKRTWGRWKQFLALISKAKEMKAVANAVREQKSISTFFNIWVMRHKELIAIQEKCQELQEILDYRIKSNIFFSWRWLIRKKNCKREILKLSWIRYEHKMKSKIFKALKKFHLQRKQKKEYLERVRNFREIHITLIFIQQWLEICEGRLEKHKLENMSLATRHHEMKLVSATFNRLKNLVKIRKCKRNIIDKAKVFYIKSVLYNSLNRCLASSRALAYCKLLDVKAQRFRMKTILKAYLLKMVKIVTERKIEQEQINEMQYYYDRIILGRTFSRWKFFFTKKSEKRRKGMAMVLYYEAILKNRAFKGWKHFMLNKYKKKSAEEFWNFKVLSRTLKAFRLLREGKLAQQRKIDYLLSKSKLRIKETVFRIWKNEITIFRDKEVVAFSFWRRKIHRKIMNKWKDFVEMKFQNRRRINLCWQNFTILVIRRTVLHWYQLYKFKLYLNDKVRTVKKKEEEKLVRRYFISWYKHKKKTENIITIGLSFHSFRKFILMESFLCYMKIMLNAKKYLQVKLREAKLLQDKQLKRKYILRWVQFIKWKKGLIQKTLKLYFTENLPEESEMTLISPHERVKPIIPFYLRCDASRNKDFDVKVCEKHNDTYKVLHPVNFTFPVVTDAEF